MSLISDALKTGQRQRPDTSNAGGQPLLEGFFPYVSGSAPRRSNRKPIIIAFSAVGVVLLAVVAWTMLPSSGTARPPAKGIVLPVRDSVPPLQATAPGPSRLDSIALAAAVARGISAAGGSPAGATGAGTRAVPMIPASGAEALSRPVAPTPRVPAPASVRATEPSRQVPVVGATTASARGDAASAGVSEPGARTQSASTPADPVTSSPPRSVVAAADSRSRIDYEAQATALYNAGDLQGAREAFRLATRNSPSARAWTNYGVTLQRLGDFQGASAAYESAIGIDGNYLEAWLYQGRLAVIRGESHRAVPLFQRARAINSRHPGVNTDLAELEANARNWTEARRFAEDAIRVEAENWRAQWFLAVAADELKDHDVAARAYAGYLQHVGAPTSENAANIGWARRRIAQIKGGL